MLADAIPSPFKNEQEARYAQNGALPPDLSLIAKARGVDAGTPFYRVPDTMLRDIAQRLPGRRRRLRLRLPHRLRASRRPT